MVLGEGDVVAEEVAGAAQIPLTREGGVATSKPIPSAPTFTSTPTAEKAFVETSAAGALAVDTVAVIGVEEEEDSVMGAGGRSSARLVVVAVWASSEGLRTAERTRSDEKYDLLKFTEIRSGHG